MTDLLDNERRSWEYETEIEGLRQQNDLLRSSLAELRGMINGYRTNAEDAQRRMRQMEDARAGVTGVRHFFRRNDGAENVALYHYTIDGTRSVCRARIDPSKYELIESAVALDGLCTRCAPLFSVEISHNPYENREIDHSPRKGAIDKHNAPYFNIKPDLNPLFTTYVYFIQAEGEMRFKVGISTEPRKRLTTLRHAAGRSLKILILSEPCTSDGARSVEYAVKIEFDEQRVAQEWYRLNWQQVKRVKEIITSTVAKDRNKNTLLRVVK